VSAPARTGAGAFFDVDGTLTKSDIFRDLVAFRRAQQPSLAFDASIPLRGLALLLLDLVDRAAVNRLTYSWYAGSRRENLEGWALAFQQGPGLRRCFPRMLDVLAAHARRGDRIVFVTGAVDAIVAPLPRVLARHLGIDSLADTRIEAIRLEEQDGVFTGRLRDEPLAGDAKAQRVRAMAREEGIDLPSSYAYGDSIADAPMLGVVGRPCAVRPDIRLRRLARRRGWPVIDAAPRGSP
jgi:HAD superfamily hydrolase (TIGR01490 family)